MLFIHAKMSLEEKEKNSQYMHTVCSAEYCWPISVRLDHELNGGIDCHSQISGVVLSLAYAKDPVVALCRSIDMPFHCPTMSVFRAYTIPSADFARMDHDYRHVEHFRPALCPPTLKCN